MSSDQSGAIQVQIRIICSTVLIFGIAAVVLFDGTLSDIKRSIGETKLVPLPISN